MTDLVDEVDLGRTARARPSPAPPRLPGRGGRGGRGDRGGRGGAGSRVRPRWPSAVLLAAWSGHAAGVARGRTDGARDALAGTRVLVWFVGDGNPDGAGAGRLSLGVATGSGRAVTLRSLRVGPDTVVPVRPLAVPAGSSAAGTVVARSGCGSARELELMRAGPGSDHVADLSAQVVEPDGTVRTVPVVLLPDDGTFRTLLRLAACPGADPAGSP